MEWISGQLLGIISWKKDLLLSKYFTASHEWQKIIHKYIDDY